MNDLIALGGIALVAVGLFLMWPALAVVFAGLILIALAVADARVQDEDEGGQEG